MGKLILVIGGARSGKSRYALALAEDTPRKTLIATLKPLDEEMEERVRSHRRERGPGWRVIEEPIKVAEAVAAAAGKCELVLVDCVTLWLTNLLLAGRSENNMKLELERLRKLAAKPPCRLLIVSNEVGLGIVPADRLTRQFRDLQGAANQMLAQSAAEVVMMVSGLPLKLKEPR